MYFTRYSYQPACGVTEIPNKGMEKKRFFFGTPYRPKFYTKNTVLSATNLVNAIELFNKI